MKIVSQLLAVATFSMNTEGSLVVNGQEVQTSNDGGVKKYTSSYDMCMIVYYDISLPGAADSSVHAILAPSVLHFSAFIVIVAVNN